MKYVFIILILGLFLITALSGCVDSGVPPKDPTGNYGNLITTSNNNPAKTNDAIENNSDNVLKSTVVADNIANYFDLKLKNIYFVFENPDKYMYEYSTADQTCIVTEYTLMSKYSLPLLISANNKISSGLIDFKSHIYVIANDNQLVTSEYNTKELYLKQGEYAGLKIYNCLDKKIDFINELKNINQNLTLLLKEENKEHTLNQDYSYTINTILMPKLDIKDVTLSKTTNNKLKLTFTLLNSTDFDLDSLNTYIAVFQNNGNNKFTFDRGLYRDDTCSIFQPVKANGELVVNCETYRSVSSSYAGTYSVDLKVYSGYYDFINKDYNLMIN